MIGGPVPIGALMPLVLARVLAAMAAPQGQIRRRRGKAVPE
jgi:hypothetical protein